MNLRDYGIIPLIKPMCGSAASTVSRVAPQASWRTAMRYQSTIPAELDEIFLRQFWSLVDRSGGDEACWPWLGSRQSSGHGRFNFRGCQWLAHRFMWAITRGPIPDGLFVCHNCPGGDHSWCVNPAHLWLGTGQQNTADRDAKGRSARGDRSGMRLHPESVRRGSQSPHAVLTEELAMELRLLAETVTVSELARRFGIARKTVRQVIQRKTWTHV